MNPDILNQLGLDQPAAPAAAAIPDKLERLHRLHDLAAHLALFQAELMIALVGLGLLVLMLAPERHRRAVARLGSHGGRSFLLGAALFIAVLALLAALMTHGIPRGQPLLLTLLVFGAGAGVSVCARALGERVLPDRGPVAQTALGLAALVLPLAILPALPVLLVAAPLGLGAFIAPSKASVTSTPS